MKKSLFELYGKTVVVTGGLGLLGRSFTRCLAQQGVRVIVLDSQPAPKDPYAFFDLKGDVGSVEVFRVDITQRRLLEATYKRIQKKYGTPDGLINNAGVDAPPGTGGKANGNFEDYPESEWDKVMAVNVKGIFLADQIIGGAMAKAGGGSIIHINSIYGMVSPDQRIYAYRAQKGQPFNKPVAYSASKSSLINLTRYLATYWAPKNVRVNTLTCGGVSNGQDKAFVKGYTARVPMGRMARPDEYNGALLFLLSDASSYMTGSNLVIDGGWTAW